MDSVPSVAHWYFNEDSWAHLLFLSLGLSVCVFVQKNSILNFSHCVHFLLVPTQPRPWPPSLRLSLSYSYRQSFIITLFSLDNLIHLEPACIFLSLSLSFLLFLALSLPLDVCDVCECCAKNSSLWLKELQKAKIVCFFSLLLKEPFSSNNRVRVSESKK